MDWLWAEGKATCQNSARIGLSYQVCAGFSEMPKQALEELWRFNGTQERDPVWGGQGRCSWGWGEGLVGDWWMGKLKEY